ncbi:hypothetical protein H6F47_21880 [Sphaerospermopsis sp. FACHB-1094]|uniref:hypothetical protein n=1 Tax=Sphaerospermopsis sp. FACHB-1094 TaxID=2692861 RepID=UPI0016850B61|nr:hypothetical protein [Sphaerospermopsis sp. FACHB-1094]
MNYPYFRSLLRKSWYYHHEKEKVSQYIADWLEWSHKMREEQRKNPHPVVQKLMEIKAV